MMATLNKLLVVGKRHSHSATFNTESWASAHRPIGKKRCRFRLLADQECASIISILSSMKARGGQAYQICIEFEEFHTLICIK